MLYSFILLLASCFADVDMKPDMQSHAEFLKPGAAVQIRHDYEGHTTLNSYETISIDVTHIYQNGVLDIKVLPSLDLDILSPLDAQSVHITPDVAPKIAVQFSGQRAGHFSIALEIVHEDSTGGQARRVLSIPVQIGNADQQKSPETIAQSHTTSSRIIALEAKETVY